MLADIARSYSPTDEVDDDELAEDTHNARERARRHRLENRQKFKPDDQ